MTKDTLYGYIRFMTFDDFNLEKSKLNKIKHGIDFFEAREIWNDPWCLDGAPATTVNGEQRWFAIGMTQSKLWTVCYTLRPNGIRIISVRSTRDEEKRIYGQE